MGWDNGPRKDEPQVRETPPHRSRKNTRDWCRGKVGVAHQVDALIVRFSSGCRVGYQWRPPYEAQWWCSHWTACSTCGKVREKLPSDQCPDRPAKLPPPRLPRSAQ